VTKKPQGEISSNVKNHIKNAFIFLIIVLILWAGWKIQHLKTVDISKNTGSGGPVEEVEEEQEPSIFPSWKVSITPEEPLSSDHLTLKIVEHDGVELTRDQLSDARIRWSNNGQARIDIVGTSVPGEQTEECDYWSVRVVIKEQVGMATTSIGTNKPLAEPENQQSEPTSGSEDLPSLPASIHADDPSGVLALRKMLRTDQEMSQRPGTSLYRAMLRFPELTPHLEKANHASRLVEPRLAAEAVKRATIVQAAKERIQGLEKATSKEEAQAFLPVTLWTSNRASVLIREQANVIAKPELIENANKKLQEEAQTLMSLEGSYREQLDAIRAMSSWVSEKGRIMGCLVN